MTRSLLPSTFLCLALLITALPAAAGDTGTPAAATAALSADLMSTENPDCAAEQRSAEWVAAGLAPTPEAASTRICSPCSATPCRNVPEGNFCHYGFGQTGYCLEWATGTCQGDPVAAFCQCATYYP